MAEEIRAEMVANVWKVVAAAGDEVAEGDTLVILESMKMEIPVLAESDGTVAQTRRQRGRRGPGGRPDRGHRMTGAVRPAVARPTSTRSPQLTVAAYGADGQLDGDHGYDRCLPTWRPGPASGELLVAVDEPPVRWSARSRSCCPGTRYAELSRGRARRSSGCWRSTPAAQGRGVGEALVAGLLSRAPRSWAVTAVVICVRDIAAAARRLYDRLGLRRGSRSATGPRARRDLLGCGRLPARPVDPQSHDSVERRPQGEPPALVVGDLRRRGWRTSWSAPRRSPAPRGAGRPGRRRAGDQRSSIAIIRSRISLPAARLLTTVWFCSKKRITDGWSRVEARVGVAREDQLAPGLRGRPAASSAHSISSSTAPAGPRPGWRRSRPWS